MKANNKSNIAKAHEVKPVRHISRVRTFLPVLMIAAAAITSVSCGGKAGEEIAARVGGNAITMDQVNSTIKQQLDASGGSQAPFTPAELVSAQLSVLNNLIQMEALFIRAQQEKLVPDDSKVTEAIQKRKQDSKLTEDEFERQLKQAGLNDEMLRDQAKRELAISALRDKEKGLVKAPTNDDIRKYFDDHKADFVAERGADISIIVTDPANNGLSSDAVGDAAAEQKIRSIYEQLKSGADFATVAMQSEDAASAQQGGEVGFGSEDQLKQSFATKPDLPARLMSMTPGQFTEPVNIGGRWYIIKLNGKRESAQALKFDDPNVRQNIVDRINQERQQTLWNALVMLTLAETPVKNYLADRVVANPDTMTMMKPSKLLEDLKPIVQATPRMEDEAPSSPGPGAATSKSPAKKK